MCNYPGLLSPLAKRGLAILNMQLMQTRWTRPCCCLKCLNKLKMQETFLSNNVLEVSERGKSFTGRQSKSSCFLCFEADGHFIPLGSPQYNRHLPKGWEVTQGCSVPGDWVASKSTVPSPTWVSQCQWKTGCRGQMRGDTSRLSSLRFQGTWLWVPA